MNWQLSRVFIIQIFFYKYKVKAKKRCVGLFSLKLFGLTLTFLMHA